MSRLSARCFVSASASHLAYADRPLDIFPCNVSNVVCNNGVPTSTGNPYDTNFPIVASGTRWASYDFASIMHYPRCAFSPVCPVFPCNCTTAQETMHVREPYTAAWNMVIGTATCAGCIPTPTTAGTS